MEISTQEFRYIELIGIMGRVDSVEAVWLEKALASARRRNKSKIVVDMSQVEYMSSAGLRALSEAQRKSRHDQHGEVILANVPPKIHEILEIVGFTTYFHIEKTVSAALAFAEKSLERDPASKP